MNILYLVSDPRIELTNIAGHATHILKTIDGLEKIGHSVYCIAAGERATAKRAKSTFRKVKSRVPRIIKITLRDIYALAHDRNFFRYCWQISQGKKFDFIYERSTVYHQTGRRLARALGIPLILEVNSPVEEMVTLYGCTRIMRSIAEHCERLIASTADAIVVGSAAMRSYLVEKGIRAEMIFVIYPTASDNFFTVSRRRTSIRQKFGIEAKVVVGFVGSMAPYQRVDLLLQAAVNVSRSSKAIHFLIVGDGPMMNDWRRLAGDSGLTKYVSFSGRVPYEEVPEYCGAMDICVVPHATWYGSPTKLFEYGASGRAVIAPRVQPIQELIRHGENGMLMELGNVDDLTEKIRTLAADPTLAKRLGNNLREEIVQDHVWSKNTERLIGIFESIRENNFSVGKNR